MKDCKILKNIIIKEIAGHGIRTLKNLELSKRYTCLNVHGYTGHLSIIIKALVSAAHLSGALSARSSGCERERERSIFSDT